MVRRSAHVSANGGADGSNRTSKAGRPGRSERAGFTLIELLIVVAIIAILAAIAVPNFFEAQVRSKVARAKNDLRTLATAIESYTVDQLRAPLGYWEYYQVRGDVPVNLRNWCFIQITTPVAYLTSWIHDPFAKFPAEGYKREESKFYVYQTFLASVYRERATPGNRYHDCKARGYIWAAYSIGPRAVTETPWVPDMLQGAGSVSSLDFSLSTDFREALTITTI